MVFVSKTSKLTYCISVGKTSNYAVVMAMLKIGHKNYGMHGFLVQLRDLNTHEPCPGDILTIDASLNEQEYYVPVIIIHKRLDGFFSGITLGDIGPKLGYGMTDNGFASFDHVRIPRRNMLMKHAKVFLGDTLYI